MDIFIQRISELEADIAQLRHVINNMFREARVKKVYDDGTAEVVAHGAQTHRIPWVQRAGSIRDWEPPTENERVLMLSPGGDPSRGLILPGGYSDNYPQPHNALGESRRQVGSSVDTTAPSSRIIEAQLIILRGTVKIEGPSLTHNGVNVGDTHTHGGIVRGGARTDQPG